MVKQESKMNSSSSSSLKKRFKGVRMRSWGSWVSEIRAPNQKTRIWLGSYSTAEAAARAYDAALLCLKGSKANLNFPKSIPNFDFSHHNTLTVPMSPKSIQKIAAAAATATADLLQTSPPSPVSSSSSSELSSLSPELSSSSEVRIDDDLISLAAADCGGGGDGGGGDGGDCDYSWYSFDSPKYYYEMMNNGVFFDPTMAVEDSEDADIRLWSFC